jgi:hypothetical protein
MRFKSCAVAEGQAPDKGFDVPATDAGTSISGLVEVRH